jgi:hypothetical protein
MRVTPKYFSLLSKVKMSHYTPWRLLGVRRYSSYSFLTYVLGGVSGQHHTLAVLYLWGKEPPVPI